jgi:hypothetical protein
VRRDQNNIDLLILELVPGLLALLFTYLSNAAIDKLSREAYLPSVSLKLHDLFPTFLNFISVLKLNGALVKIGLGMPNDEQIVILIGLSAYWVGSG